MSAQRAPVRFGEFVLDRVAGDLRKNGTRLKLALQPFRILVILLERPGQVVTREELHSHVWPEGTYVDFDAGLRVCINRLREVLGDSAEEPRYIETLPRRGYRFIAQVEVAQSEEESPAAVTAATASDTAELRVSAAPATHTRWRAYALTAVALIVLAAVLGWRLTRQSPGPGRVMLAVLPFENLSANPEQEYFSDGMTEEMITRLGHLQPQKLGVIAGASVMGYKHSGKNVADIGRELGVQYVLEGSVRRDGQKVRVTAQFIDVRDQSQLWAQTYDRDLRDVFSVQSEVTQAIADEILVKLDPQLQIQWTAHHVPDPEAHELYLKGRYFFNKRDRDGYSKAIEYFQGAIQHDPEYALAYVGLGDTYFFLGSDYTGPGEAASKARIPIEKALSLDKDLAEAHTSLALITPILNWDWEESSEHYQRALELSPNYATAHHWYADGYLAPMGRLDEAIAEMRKAQELDPLSSIITVDVGKDLFMARRYDEAIAQLKKALELSPTFPPAHYWLFYVYIENRMFDEAAKEVEFVRVQETANPASAIWFQTYLDARAGRQQQARQGLDKLSNYSHNGVYISAGGFAALYIALEEKEQALQWLERSYSAKETWMTSLKIWPLYDPLRSDPRFQNLIRRVGLD